MKKPIIFILLTLLICCAAFYFIYILINQAQSVQGKTALPEYWPTDGWRVSTPEEQGMDSALLADMIRSIQQDGKSVDSITIIRNGYKVGETYFYPYQQGIKHAVNSCTKGFVSALTGIGLAEGQIKSLDDRVIDYFPDSGIQNIDARKQKLSIRNLLNMTVGLDWKFEENVSLNEMLQTKNWTRYTLDLPMREEPGGSFNYCNGAANVMSSIIQKTAGKSAAELAAERLNPLGLDMYWSTMPENVNTGYSGIFMTPDDMAKFGYLYLNKGNWNGQQIVPEKWVEESTEMQTKANWNALFPGYGYMWWVNSFGGYAAMGFGGDYIFVIPDQNLVVVFTGGMFNNEDLFYPAELMDQYIVPSIKSNGTIAPNKTAYDSLRHAVDAVQNTAPKPVPPLPQTAEAVSGRPFKINGGDVITLNFKDGSNEFTYDQNSQLTLTVGLDDVYRVVDVGGLFGSLPDHNQRALKGSWLDANTLQMITQDLQDGYESVYLVRFENEKITLSVKTNLGQEQTASAEFVG